MEIILKQDFKGLGYKNDLVQVKPGYGRNYLIPKGFAVVANVVNKKIAEENARQIAHKVVRYKQEAEKLAAQLSQIELQIAAKAGEKNKIFGAITAMQVIEVLQTKAGFVADRRDISFDYPIKTLGKHQVHVKLNKEVSCTLSVEIIAEEKDK
jgi:large subunit ribosomal protein L9